MSEDQLVSGKSPIQDAALALMRKPFAEHQISKMCKSTKKDNQPGRCRDCGGYHKLPSVQLSYVGHAALTDRLLDADPCWTWEPLALAPDGSPLLDANGGLWIKLTVAGVTRLGYGDAQGKVGGDAMKERIGDALRNAGMRFGAALDLWHKGDLHPAIEVEEPAATFEKKADGNFVRKTDNVVNVGSNPPVTTVGKLPATVQPTEIAQKEATKPVTRKKKESVPDAGKPWGGTFEPPVIQKDTTASLPASNAITPENPITDADVPFPGDPEPKPVDKRLATDEERKDIMDRLIVLKDKGFSGVREYLMKETGVARTNDIPYVQFIELVDRLEKAESAGTLKDLLK
jgi:hypothetical protein